MAQLFWIEVEDQELLARELRSLAEELNRQPFELATEETRVVKALESIRRDFITNWESRYAKQMQPMSRATRQRIQDLIDLGADPGFVVGCVLSYQESAGRPKPTGPSAAKLSADLRLAATNLKEFRRCRPAYGRYLRGDVPDLLMAQVELLDRLPQESKEPGDEMVDALHAHMLEVADRYEHEAIMWLLGTLGAKRYSLFGLQKRAARHGFAAADPAQRLRPTLLRHA